MSLPIRSLLAPIVLAVALAACGATVDAPTADSPSASPTDMRSESPSPSQPAAPSEAPTDERDVDGVITVFPGTVSGPGGSIADAIADGPTGDMPILVNGVLFRDTDGRIFLATAVADAASPTFDGPMLEVIGFPADGASWDMANAEMLGLEEANGVVFKVDAQVLGTIELP